MSLVSRLSGVTRKTIINGIKELNNPNTNPPQIGKSRKKGGGRKTIQNNQPDILNALQNLVEPHTKGDPMHQMLWTNKSLRNLEKSLKEKGFQVSYRVIGVMLKNLGYGLQADKKNPNRNTCTS